LSRTCGLKHLTRRRVGDIHVDRDSGIQYMPHKDEISILSLNERNVGTTRSSTRSSCENEVISHYGLENRLYFTNNGFTSNGECDGLLSRESNINDDYEQRW